MTLANPWRVTGWSLAALLLLIPVAMMQLRVEGWKWTGGDFVFAGVMIGGTGLLFELAARRSAHLAYRIGAGVALLAAFGLVWVNGAVGFIGEPGNPLNLGFLGVIAIAFGGSALARFRSSGMAWAMAAAALAQAAMGVLAMSLEWRLAAPSAVFVAMWLAAGACFRKSAAD